jgi:hypothetical protein
LLNLSLIRRQKPDPKAIHFNSTEHSVNDYEIVALQKICGDNSYRETIEKLLWSKISFNFLSRLNAKIGGFMNTFFIFSDLCNTVFF